MRRLRRLPLEKALRREKCSSPGLVARAPSSSRTPLPSQRSKLYSNSDFLVQFEPFRVSTRDLPPSR